MRAPFLIALCCLPLEPIAAQHIVEDSAATRVSRSPTQHLGIAGPMQGVRVDRYAYVSDGGGADVRQGVVGTLPVADNASIGLGLYRVTRYSRGEPNFKKLLPMEDVDGRHQRIAAVGMSIRF